MTDHEQQQRHYQDVAALKVRVAELSDGWHLLDKRIAVMETKSETLEHEISAVRCDLGEIRHDARVRGDLLRRIDEKLDRHMDDEGKESRKALNWMRTLIGTTLASAALIVFEFYLKH